VTCWSPSSATPRPPARAPRTSAHDRVLGPDPRRVQRRGLPGSFANIKAYQVEGDRVAILENGRLHVKDDRIGFLSQGADVTSFQLEGNRIAITRSDQPGLWVKEDQLDRGRFEQVLSTVRTQAQPVARPGDARSYVLDRQRIAAIGTDGVLRVQEGALDTAWTTLGSATAVQMISDSGPSVPPRSIQGPIGIAVRP
jgi:hypothetical protein